MVTCYLYFFVFSFVFVGLFISRCLLWRSGRANVSSAGWFLASFFHFSLWFWKSDLHFSVDFWLTCAPQPHSSLSSAPAAASSSRVSCRWSARGSHVPKSSAMWCAWGPRSAFFMPFLAATNYTTADLRLSPVMARVPHAPPSRILAFSPTAGSLFFVFFTVCFFFVFFSYISSLSLLVFWSNFMGISVG